MSEPMTEFSPLTSAEARALTRDILRAVERKHRTVVIDLDVARRIIHLAANGPDEAARKERVRIAGHRPVIRRDDPLGTGYLDCACGQWEVGTGDWHAHLAAITDTGEEAAS